MTTLLALNALVLAGGAAAASTSQVGETAAAPGDVKACAAGSLYLQGADVAAPTYATTAGVITSWSVMAGSIGDGGSGGPRLKVARESPASTWTITGSSDQQQLSPEVLNSFAARIPVSAGDRIGLYLPAGGPTVSCYRSTASIGDVMVFKSGNALADPAVGQVVVTNAASTKVRMDVSVRIETDADGDGYGDDTQDLCPSRADKQKECVPPDTTLSAPKKVKTAKRKAKVTVTFGSTEPDSTFACLVDGKAKTCGATPWTLKLKIGKHQLVVTATDASGNVDPTPAEATVKVKRKQA